MTLSDEHCCLVFCYMLSIYYGHLLTWLVCVSVFIYNNIQRNRFVAALIDDIQIHRHHGASNQGMNPLDTAQCHKTTISSGT